MPKLSRRQVLVAGSVGAAAMATAGCSDPGGDAATEALDPSAKVSISVGDQPTEDKPDQLAAFNKRIEEFKAANQNIAVEASPEKWEAQTFQAKLAGGTLPTVMGVSLTYSHELIENGQLPDMTPYLDELGLVADLNPLALDNAKDDGGKIYTIPTGLFSVGIAYNRAIFAKAGLDPDTPPATWEDVRAFARQIKAKVGGVTPYAQMTTNNTGGWMLTTMTYSLGGRVQNDAGTEAVMGQQTIDALQLLHDMRWGDDTMGREFLYDQEAVRQAFAGGTIGMVLQAPDCYFTVVKDYGFDPADYGQGALPQGGAGGNGTLTGGTLKLFDAKATPNQLLAAAKWIKFYDFDKYYDQAAALADAESNAANNSPVGLPGLPPVSQAVYDRYLGWIKPHINVPLEQFTGYTAATLPLIAEPPAGTQQTYAALDPVVQQILTDEGADIVRAVADANATVKGIIDQAAR
ncbi:ABC transporter substrate-binding protein [Phytomonospora endophytica]|uniref:ABC-type glycerol-3-phosphate transport system substrate-binding protein n=1 Tax=Phytomonospora endophytica TaxID=714109 RepID=A0A841FKM2_9ACTN|nr:extracellular solute-binding protein [Phytomonospora endophytica]MBB6037881.1 ABC-type glycerol-3-phosphate transport system substrate-binding protein [Phytomonospora endophytica]GIG68780.1 sugar ABC transporter substrate-binding protein [Phytomonospora endophytica]